MYSRAVRRSAVRIGLAVIICAALLPVANISLLVQSNAQQRSPARPGTCGLWTKSGVCETGGYRAW